MDSPAWIATSAAVVAVLLNIVLVLWRGGRNSADDLSKMESRITQTIAETARDMEARHDEIAKQVGDSINAIRETMRLNEKELVDDIHSLADDVRKVEIWARDEFVRKESFREVAADIRTMMLENMRNVNSSVQSVRDAIIQAITTGKVPRDGRDHAIPG